MHLSYGADHPRLIRMVTYALVGSAVEFACAVWADGRRTGGNASFMDACQKAWHAPLGTALRVSQRASGVVLRGDMGVWSVLARWDAMRLIMYFRYALLPGTDWRAVVYAAGRQLAEGNPPCAQAWHTHTHDALVRRGFPAQAWADPQAYLAAQQPPITADLGQPSSTSRIRALVMGLIHAHEAATWRVAVQAMSRLRHTYALLGESLPRRVRPYLLTPRRRAQVIRARLRCDSYEWLRTFYFRYHRQGDRWLPYHERICSCNVRVYTGRRVRPDPPDSVTHFLLDCMHVNVHRCRRRMWKRILALAGTHPDAGPIVAVVAEALGWAHPRPVPAVVGRVGAGPRRLLLRLILEGDLTDVMPEGYMDIERRRMCGPAEVHCSILEITDEFLCAADTLRSSFERDWRAARQRHHNRAERGEEGYSLLM